MTIPATPLESPDRADERDLIARVLLGDRSAARALYDAHVSRVHRVVFRLCGDAELAGEFTQDTFVRAFQQLAKFRGESSFATWLHRVAVTTAMNGLRKVKRIRDREVALEHAGEMGAWEHGTDHALKQRLHAALEALPESQRSTLILHDLEGYTHQEIATTLGVAEGTSKSRLFMARNALRRTLADLAPDVQH